MKPPPFELAPNETLLHAMPASLIRGIVITSGRVWLTDQRIVFHPVVPWPFWLMPLVGLVLWLMNKGSAFVLPLVDITSRERTSFGRNQNVLRLATRAGETKLLVEPFDDFMTKLKEAA